MFPLVIGVKGVFLDMSCFTQEASRKVSDRSPGGGCQPARQENFPSYMVLKMVILQVLQVLVIDVKNESSLIDVRNLQDFSNPFQYCCCR